MKISCDSVEINTSVNDGNSENIENSATYSDLENNYAVYEALKVYIHQVLENEFDKRRW